MSMKVSDSHWHKQLSDLSEHAKSDRKPILGCGRSRTTVRSAHTWVGSYDEVAEVVSDYMKLGYTNFILDVPGQPEDLAHAGKVFKLATAAAHS